MYKLFFLLTFSPLCAATFAQIPRITPGNNPFDSKLIKNEAYTMHWMMIRDTMEVKIAEVKTEIKTNNDTLLVITSIQMNHSPILWVDSTAALLSTLQPVYHSSYNQNRDMVLHFGSEVTGYYLDKASREKATIFAKTAQTYFDSNIYPQLIRWLPLKKGYKALIPIFDYNPVSKASVMNAYIEHVEIQNDASTRNKVYVVTATDDISKRESTVRFYIDAKTRELLKQEIEVSDRKMVMKRVD